MSFSRRGFLTGIAAGTVAASSARAAGGKHFTGYEGRYGLLHDSTLCVGCRSCELACTKVNDMPAPATPIGDTKIFDQKRGVTDKLYTVVNRYREAKDKQPAVYRKHQCMHCNEPCCASVCFVKAFVKTPEGPVLYDPEVCVGCRYCVFACPYYALAYEYDDPLTPKVVRCTMCYPRIKEGKNPACADACPTGAIQFGRRKDLIKLAQTRMRKYPGRYVDHLFGEHEYGGTSWLTLTGVPAAEVNLPQDVSHDPLPNLTTSFLSLAPLVTAIFPGLLVGFYAFTKRNEALKKKEMAALVAKERAQAEAHLEETLAAKALQAQRNEDHAVADAVREALRLAQKSAAADSAKEEAK